MSEEQICMDDSYDTDEFESEVEKGGILLQTENQKKDEGLEIANCESLDTYDKLDIRLMEECEEVIQWLRNNKLSRYIQGICVTLGVAKVEELCLVSESEQVQIGMTRIEKLRLQWALNQHSITSQNDQMQDTTAHRIDDDQITNLQTQQYTDNIEETGIQEEEQQLEDEKLEEEEQIPIFLSQNFQVPIAGNGGYCDSEHEFFLVNPRQERGLYDEKSIGQITRLIESDKRDNLRPDDEFDLTSFCPSKWVDKKPHIERIYFVFPVHNEGEQDEEGKEGEQEEEHEEEGDDGKQIQKTVDVTDEYGSCLVDIMDPQLASKFKIIKIPSEIACQLCSLQNPEFNIRKLGCWGQHIGEHGAYAISRFIGTCDELDEIRLGSGGIGPIGVEHIAQSLLTHDAVQTVSLGGNSQIGDQGTESICKLIEANGVIKRLYLWGIGMRTQGAQLLASAIRSNSDLQVLSLKSNKIKDGGLKELSSGLKGNNSIEVLSLSDNGITGSGVKHLAVVLKTTVTSKECALTKLYLSHNELKDEGAKLIADALKNNSSIKVLYLNKNGIGPDGGNALAEMLQENSTVTHLNLSNNRIGVEGAQALSAAIQQNQTLTWIDLWNNQIRTEGQVALRKAADSKQEQEFFISFLY